jgi:hypothetical protein
MIGFPVPAPSTDEVMPTGSCLWAATQVSTVGRLKDKTELVAVKPGMLKDGKELSKVMLDIVAGLLVKGVCNQAPVAEWAEGDRYIGAYVPSTCVPCIAMQGHARLFALPAPLARWTAR